MKKLSEQRHLRSLSTKYYYKQDRLCFQICLIFDNDKLELRDFTDHNEYRLAFDTFALAMNSNRPVAMMA